MRFRSLARAVGPRLLRGAVAAAGLCLPVAVLALLVTRHFAPIVDLDERVVVAATDVTRAHPGFEDALIGWQSAFHPTMVYLYAIPVAVWTWLRGFRARTIWGVVTMLVGWNLGLQVKLIVERARPVAAAADDLDVPGDAHRGRLCERRASGTPQRVSPLRAGASPRSTPHRSPA